MATTRSAVAVFAAACVLALTAPGAGANVNSETTPEVVDGRGDAYFVNGQGRVGGLESPPDGGPASIPSADILAISFETRYQTQVIRDDGGRITAVQHVPDGLHVHFRTAAPVKPTFGPGMVFRMPVTTHDGCDMNLELWVGGQTSWTPLERAEGGAVQKLRTSCPGGGATIRAGVSWTRNGDVATVTIPFTLHDSEGLFADGVELLPYAHPHTRIQAYATPAAVDEAKPGRSFVIGSDVPADVHCATTPDHPGCT